MTGDDDKRYDRARQGAAAQGLTLTGDALMGKFAGSGLEGTYVVSGATLTVAVAKKPFFASWETVEAQLRTLFQA